MLIVGIDPGLGGAAFRLDSERPAFGEAIDLPVHLLVRGGKTKREVDIQGLVGLLTSRPVDHAFVERAGAMPGQGTASMFAFGKAFGIVLGVLAALEIPVTLATPAQWKRALQVPKGKHGARARASQLLPACASQWRFVKDHGRAEAALLAVFGAGQLNFATSPVSRPLESRRVLGGVSQTLSPATADEKTAGIAARPIFNAINQ